MKVAGILSEAIVPFHADLGFAVLSRGHFEPGPYIEIRPRIGGGEKPVIEAGIGAVGRLHCSDSASNPRWTAPPQRSFQSIPDAPSASPAHCLTRRSRTPLRRSQ